jgi:lysophospholipase L1-like esterase
MTEHTLIAESNSPSAREKIGPEFRAHFTHTGLVHSFAAANRILGEVAKDKNIPFIDFSSDLGGREQFFRDHVHWSPEGRSALMRLLEPRLEQILGKIRSRRAQ